MSARTDDGSSPSAADPVRRSTSISGAGYLAAIALLPCMVLELVSLVPSLLSTACLAVIVVAAVLDGGRFPVTRWYALHLATLGVFVALVVAHGEWGVPASFRGELLAAVQALIAAPAISALLVGRRPLARRFLRDSAIGVVLVGGTVATLGLGKLWYMAQGVTFESLYLADGRYPPGAALQQDYNQAALGLLIALAFAFWRLEVVRGAIERWVLRAAILPLVAAVLLATSRRGLAFLGVLLVVVLARATWRVVVRPQSVRAATIGGALGVVGLLGVIAWPQRLALSDWATRTFALGTSTARLAELGDRDRLLSTRAPLVADALAQLQGEYGPTELFVGRGTRYLFEMGSAFDSESGIEYPHNFVLSAMLHGGFLLTTLVLLLVLRGLVSAWQRWPDAWPLMVTTLLGVAFALTSSTSLYSHELLYTLLVAAAASGAWFERAPLTAPLTAPRIAPPEARPA